MGSVFSPYYWYRGHARPEDHVTINVALYGPRHHWAMTERGESALERTATTFRVGPSAMAWDGARLTLDFDERSTPFPRLERGYPMRGRIVLHAETLGTEEMALTEDGRHRWQPLAPTARVEVDVAEPALSWRGHGYMDTNSGSEMLEDGFRRWDWSRARLSDGRAVILYDMEAKDGTPTTLALEIREDGKPRPIGVPVNRVALRRGWWGVRRRTLSEGDAFLHRAFEDSPFYTRAAIETELMGEHVLAVHETLDCRRFASPVVKAMLPMRMPRRA
ncbi:MAG: carotenoid 1,2-hydratase [Pseudomonadota bacterium]